MSSFEGDCLGSPCLPVIDRIADVRKGLYNFHKDIVWGIINLSLAVLLFLELIYGSMIFTLNFVYPQIRLWFIAFGFACLFTLNTLYHFGRFFKNCIGTMPVEITKIHQKLCGITENEPGFLITASSTKRRSIIDPVPKYSPSSFTNRPLYTYPSTLAERPVCAASSKQNPLFPSHSLSSPYSPSGQYYMSGQSSPSCQVDSFYRSPCSMDSSFSLGGVNSFFPSNDCASLLSSQSPGSFRVMDPNASWSPSMQRGSFSPPRVSPLAGLSQLDTSDAMGLQSNKRTPKKSPTSSPLRSDDYINDSNTLDNFLKQQIEQDLRQRKIAGAAEPMFNARQSMWTFSRTSSDFLKPTMQKYRYQLARSSPQSSQSVDSTRDESISPLVECDVWSRMDVSQNEVDLWSEKLRKYLGQTILVRIMNEICEVNRTLVAFGSEDIQIGEVGLSTLKQVAPTKVQVVPQLAALIPFLEVTTNQEYLVQRIKELSSGGCISAFKWNAGGEFRGKKWEENLPTDSAILMHFLCCYMDSHLPPHPKYPDGKSFTSQHFLRMPNKPNLMEKNDNLFLYETSLNPPHYKVVIEDNIWNLKRGRTNMFHAILLFLYHVKTKEHGMLRRVSLGMSGINMLWVLDS